MQFPSTKTTKRPICTHTHTFRLKLAFVSLLLSCVFSFANAQTSQSKFWIVGNQYAEFDANGIVGYKPLPIPANPVVSSTFNLFNYQGETADYSQNIWASENGGILFFIIDGSIYDGEGYLLYKESIPYPIAPFSVFSSIASPSGISEYLIAPIPETCNKYYLIAADFGYKTNSITGNVSEGENRITYRVLDMNVSNGFQTNRYGEVTEVKELNLGLTPVSNGGMIANTADVNTPSPFRLALSEVKANGIRSLFAFDQDLLLIYNLTAIQIKFANSSKDIGSDILNDLRNLGVYDRTEMEVHTNADGSFNLAAPTQVYKGNPLTNLLTPLPYTIFFFKNTSAVSNIAFDPPFKIKLTTDVTAIPKGLEFSKDGRYLYATIDQPPYLLYFDLNTLPATPPAFQSSTLIFTPLTNNFNISNPEKFALSQIELGRDGKLYFAAQDGYGVLKNSNDPFNLSGTNSFSFVSYPTGLTNPVTLGGGALPTGNTSHTTALQSLILMQDQIDGDPYETAPSDPQCCSDNATSIYRDVVVTQNATWTPTNNPFGNKATAFVRNSIILGAGVKLNIFGMTFKMGKDAKIIIKQKAEINTSQSTFTSVDCDGVMWQGFEVLGSNTAAQAVTNSQQGILKLNNSTIENARLGVSLGSVIADANGDLVPDQPNNHGGIVIAKNSTFKNNKRSVAFWNYNTNIESASIFTNSNFIIDPLLKDPTIESIDFIHLEEITGVRIKGNSFTDQNFTFNPNRPVIGISSTDANYHVTPFCACPIIIFNPHGGASGGIKADCSGCNSVPNRFEKLYKGIEAHNANAMQSVEIIGNEFVNNISRGIDLRGINFPIVVDNVFDHDVDNFAIGLSMEGCSGYQVQNNTFNAQNTLGTQDNAFMGILIDQSGLDNNAVRKNVFNGVERGIQAQQFNRKLEFQCNAFTKSFNADIDVTSGRILEGQGTCNPPDGQPANNQFSYNFSKDFWVANGVNDDTIFDQNTGAILQIINQQTSYQYSTQSGNVYNLEPRQAAINLGNTNPTKCIINYDPVIHCPDSTFTPTRKFIRNTLNALAVGRATLKKRIDGGNTFGLLEQIAANTKQLKQTLQAASPFLSDRVLTAVVSRSPRLQRNTIKKIIKLNSPLSAAVVSTINQLNPPLPSKLLENLAEKNKGIITFEDDNDEENDNGDNDNEEENGEEDDNDNDKIAKLSPMQELQAQIAAKQRKIQLNKAELIRQYLHDTLTVFNRMDSVLMVYRNTAWQPDGKEMQLSEKMSIAQALLLQGELEQAEQKITALENLTSVNDARCKLLRVEKTLQQNPNKNRALATMPAEKLIVEQIANIRHSKTEINAQALQKQVFNIEKIQIVEPLVFGSTQRRSKIWETPNTTKKTNLNTVEKERIKLYPNPSNGSFTLEYPIAKNTTRVYTFSLYDITGKIIVSKPLNNNGKSDFSFDNLEVGMYFYSLSDGSTITKRNKIVISK